jgi:peptidoglycan/LPS O-acetylase OafA/YrhL
MLVHSQFLLQKRFNSLDGLRAISILAVIWHHTAPSWVHPVLAHLGAQGVTLFFAISGFLITTLLLRERDRRGRIDFKAFYMRRSLRIFPLYYGVLLLYVVLVGLIEKNSAVGQAFFNNLPYFLTYTSNLFVPLDDGRVIFYFAWSLAAEEQFYVLWPAALHLAGKLGRAAGVLVVILLAGVAGQLMGHRFLSAVPLAIVMGALWALALHSPQAFQAVARALGWRGAPVVLAVLLAAALVVASTPHFVIHLLCAALVAACVIREDHALKHVLSNPVVAYVGAISYGMYMLHMLCKNAAVKLLGVLTLSSSGLEVFALTLVITTLLAGVSFKYYEAFFLKLKTRHER